MPRGPGGIGNTLYKLIKLLASRILHPREYRGPTLLLISPHGWLAPVTFRMIWFHECAYAKASFTVEKVHNSKTSFCSAPTLLNWKVMGWTTVWLSLRKTSYTAIGEAERETFRSTTLEIFPSLT